MSETIVALPVEQHLQRQGRVHIVPHLQHFPKAAA